MRLKYKYFIATIFLFIVEVLIATKLAYIDWLRAYFGDVLVVILIYTFMLTFLEIKNKMLLNIGVFLFACVIEFAQYFHFAEWFGLKDNTIAMIVLGNSFSWIDILCYALGCLLVLIFNFIFQKYHNDLRRTW